MERKLFTSLALAAAVLALPGCGHIGKDGGNVRRDDILVEVQTIDGRTTSGEEAGYVGNVKAGRSVLLSAKHGGTLASLKVREGEKVSAGQTIAVVESQSVRSMYDAAHATLAQAEDAYRRVSQVHESGSVADVKMVEVETKLAQARASAASADKALEDCTLKAPFGGYVDALPAEEGVELDILSPVARIVDISSVEVRISVPESEIGALKVGDRASIDVAALNLTGLKGHISAKGVSASPLSHSYDCTISLDSPAEGLMPGMVCKVRIPKNGEAGIAVPSSVVQIGNDGKYLWVVRDGKVSRAAVSTGGFSGKGVLILSGLEEGDQVIVKGYQKVSSGMRVRTVEAQ